MCISISAHANGYSYSQNTFNRYKFNNQIINMLKSGSKSANLELRFTLEYKKDCFQNNKNVNAIIVGKI